VSTDTTTFLDREETARDLRVSVTTVDRLIKAGKLRAARIGRRVVVSPQAIDQFRRQAETAEWGEAS
jgi:excisionase family DNA binding protein